MAAKRMFSKTITNSSRFLMMPQSSQNLYFHFGMNADDDGYCEHFAIMRMTDSKPDDLKILQAKEFVKVFDDQILIILDWKENNLIRSDRYTPSKYLAIYKAELKQIESGIPDDNQRVPQVRLGKVRLGKESIEEKEYYREKIKDIKQIEMGQSPDIRPPELELELDKEIEKEKKNKYITDEILLYWNSKENLQTHKVDTVKLYIKKRHNDILKSYSENEILRAIDNYSDILMDNDKYYFSHRWPIWDFIIRGLHNFLDSSTPKINYLNKYKKDNDGIENNFIPQGTREKIFNKK